MPGSGHGWAAPPHPFPWRWHVQGAESCVLAGFVLFSPVPCLVLVFQEGLEGAEGGRGPGGCSPVGAGGVGEFCHLWGHFGFHFTHSGEQVPVSAQWGPSCIPSPSVPTLWWEQDGWQMGKARSEIHELKTGPGKAENPKRLGHCWEGFARACKGFHVQRGETSPAPSVSHNEEWQCCRQGEVWRLLDSTVAPSHSDNVCSWAQELWQKFCAHELCPKGTLCHCAEQLPTVLPLASVQVAMLTNSDQGQTLPSAQSTGGGGSNVASLPDTEQKGSLYSDRGQGTFPSPWCSWDTSPAMFTWLETASEGIVECSLNRKAPPACPNLSHFYAAHTSCFSEKHI